MSAPAALPTSMERILFYQANVALRWSEVLMPKCGGDAGEAGKSNSTSMRPECR